jgi:hypothetical protein
MSEEPPEKIDQLQRRIEQIEAALQGPRTPHLSERLFDLRVIAIRRTTDVAALVALLLAVVTLVLQLQMRLDSPKLTAYPPRQVVIFNSDALKADLTRPPDQVMFATTTSYSNMALTGHDAIVLDEFIRVRVGKTKIQHWLSEVGNFAAAPVFKIEARSSRPVPFVVPAGGGFAHEVLFMPFSSPYCLAGDTGCDGANTWYSWKEFRSDVLEAGRIEVTLGAKLADQTVLLINCSIKLILGERWIDNPGDGRWWAAECF